MPRMKTGANYTDRMNIKRYAQMGHTAENISVSLGVPLKCVKSFMVKGATDPHVTLTPVEDAPKSVPKIPKLET